MSHDESHVLVSFQEPEDHLAEVGSRLVAGRLTDLGHKLLVLCEEDEGALATFGFGAAWRKALAHKLDEVDEGKGGRVLAQAEARPSGRAVAEVLGRAHKWVSRYVVVTKNAPPAIRDTAPHPTANEHSPKALATEIESLAAFVSKHAKDTESFGGGAAFASEGFELAGELSHKRTTHASELAKIAPAVHALHVIEGGDYLEIVRLSRAAHATLPHERAKLYNVEPLHPTRHLHPTHVTPPSTSQAAST